MSPTASSVDVCHYPGIGITDDTLTPVVAECDDGRLNDIQGRHVSEADVMRALDEAAPGPVAEGSVGAETGMISYGSRVASGQRLVGFPAEGRILRSECWSRQPWGRPELTMGGVRSGANMTQWGPQSGRPGEESPATAHRSR